MSRGGIPVCHVITQLELGGAQENTLYTVAHLRPPFHARLLCGPGGILDDEARRLDGVAVAFVPSLVRPIRPWRDLDALLRLVRLLRRDRPLIVHTHSSKAGILGRIAARLAGVPVVVHSIHGFGFHDAQPAPLRAALVAAERAAARLTTHFIAVSRANLERGKALGIIRPGQASLIRSGVRVAAFEAAARRAAAGGRARLRRDLGVPEEAPLVGMVACLKPQKAPLDFVEVAARVAAGEPGARFVIAGDGELRPAVEARARALGLADRLRLLGWHRDIPGLMAALDVLVLTSLWEGLPRVLPEAIATGVPIVATGVDGTADILADGETGLVCRPRDVAGLAARVMRLLRSPEEGRRLAERARRVLPEFDIDAMVRAQEELYEGLLGRAGIEVERPAVINDAGGRARPAGPGATRAGSMT
jgi:glycosyltransferase involved in cell wall biosynthesis